MENTIYKLLYDDYNIIIIIINLRKSTSQMFYKRLTNTTTQSRNEHKLKGNDQSDSSQNGNIPGFQGRNLVGNPKTKQRKIIVRF